MTPSLLLCVQLFWGYYSVPDVSVEYYIFASFPKKEFAISQSVQNTFGHVTLNRIYINFDYWFIIYVLCHGNKTITRAYMFNTLRICERQNSITCSLLSKIQPVNLSVQKWHMTTQPDCRLLSRFELKDKGQPMVLTCFVL